HEPFVWFHRWVNPTVYDQLMDVCARRGLRSPRIVQEATDRDTVLGLVQCQIGIAWVTESTRWQCPKGIALLAVVDMDVRLPFNVIWKKGNSSPLLQAFVSRVEAVKPLVSERSNLLFFRILLLTARRCRPPRRTASSPCSRESPPPE